MNYEELSQRTLEAAKIQDSPNVDGSVFDSIIHSFQYYGGPVNGEIEEFELSTVIEIELADVDQDDIWHMEEKFERPLEEELFSFVCRAAEKHLNDLES